MQLTKLFLRELWRMRGAACTECGARSVRVVDGDRVVRAESAWRLELKPSRNGRILSTNI